MDNAGVAVLWDALGSYLAAEQIELDDVELLGRGVTRTLRVTVDGDNLDLDRIAEISRGISRLLDHTDGAPEGSYQLEVTSPGLERKLNRPRHFQKSIGREAVVKTESGARRGKIASADDTGFTLELEDSSEVIGYDQVKSARTVFTWAKPEKPGAKKSGAKESSKEQR